MNTAAYWKQLGEDALMGFSVGVASVVGLDAFNALTADWKQALGVGLGGAVAMVLKGLSAKNVGTLNTTSFIKQD